MKKILIGIGIFLVFSFILGLIINSVDNSANKPNPYKSSYRTAFVNGCVSVEGLTQQACECSYDSLTNTYGDTYIVDNVGRMSAGNFTDEEVRLVSACF